MSGMKMNPEGYHREKRPGRQWADGGGCGRDGAPGWEQAARIIVAAGAIVALAGAVAVMALVEWGAS